MLRIWRVIRSIEELERRGDESINTYLRVLVGYGVKLAINRARSNSEQRTKQALDLKY